MANIINGTDTGSGGLITTGDSSDELQLQTAEVARVTLTNTAVVVNESGADVDFRVEGDTNANLLFVDASADAVLVGKTATAFSTAGTVLYPNGTADFIANGDVAIDINRLVDDGSLIRFYQAGTAVGSIGTTGGELYIDFGGSTGGAVTSRTLDDYEEGTWTPIDSSGAGLTLVSPSGKYTKIGRQVTAWAVVGYPSTANASNSAIGGLPFTIAAAAPDRSGGMIGYKTESTLVSILGEDNATYVKPRNNVGSEISNATLSGDSIHWAITYNVS